MTKQLFQIIKLNKLLNLIKNKVIALIMQNLIMMDHYFELLQ